MEDEAVRDELEALRSIYSDELHLINNNSSNSSCQYEFSLSLPYLSQYILNNLNYFTVSVPTNYPYHKDSVPIFNFNNLSLILSDAQSTSLQVEVAHIYADNHNTVCLYPMIELARVQLDKYFNQFKLMKSDEDLAKETAFNEQLQQQQQQQINTIGETSNSLGASKSINIAIVSGIEIIDRKSVFQAHVARVDSVEECNWVLSKLMQNSRISRATHNVWAYLIKQPHSSNNNDSKSVDIILSDCEDDGETAAGSRLAALLHTMKAFNVIVIVSRWFGGIELGPARFKHINNAARELLQSLQQR
jgi:hypothetical protein